MIKKTLQIFISISILIVVSSCSGNKMNGLFDLKIGMSENEIRKVVDVSLLKETELYQKNEKQIITTQNGFKELKLDYYISDKDYIIEDITLTFYQDKLYKIQVGRYNSDLEHLLTSKFGRPKIEEEKSEKPRNKNSLSNRYKYWNTNDKNTICWSSVDFYPDKSIFMYLLIIEDRRVSAIIKDYDTEKKIN